MLFKSHTNKYIIRNSCLIILKNKRDLYIIVEIFILVFKSTTVEDEGENICEKSKSLHYR